MSRLPSTKRSRSGQARRRRTVHFPTDRPYGRLLLRDREEMAHDLPEWRRMWRRRRIDLARHLRHMGLAADMRTDMLREEERWFWGEYEGATWQRERVARGDIVVRATDEVWLQITDERCDLSRLAALRRTDLWGLSLEYSVADDAINYIAGLTDLRRLYLEYDTTISDSGLARLSALSMLTDLAIDGPCLTDAGMERLHRLTRLRSLQLDCPRASVVAVARAVRTLQIEELYIDLREPLSDADVPFLCQLPASLRYLEASRKGLSRTSVAHLERALPGCYLELRWLDAPPPREHVDHDDPRLIDPWSIDLPALAPDEARAGTRMLARRSAERLDWATGPRARRQQAGVRFTQRTMVNIAARRCPHGGITVQRGWQGLPRQVRKTLAEPGEERLSCHREVSTSANWRAARYAGTPITP